MKISMHILIIDAMTLLQNQGFKVTKIETPSKWIQLQIKLGQLIGEDLTSIVACNITKGKTTEAQNIAKLEEVCKLFNIN